MSCRLFDSDRDEDPVLEKIQVAHPQAQPIHPGSYVHVPKGLPVDAPLAEFTLEGWIRPFKLQGRQGLITQGDSLDSIGIGCEPQYSRHAFGGREREREGSTGSCAQRLTPDPFIIIPLPRH